MDYIFSFYFPDVPQGLESAQVQSWGGNLEKAFGRAWKLLKNHHPKYKLMKKLLPASIGIHRIPPTKKGNSYKCQML